MTSPLTARHFGTISSTLGFRTYSSAGASSRTKALGVRTVYLEVYDRIDLPTLTGRLYHPLSDLFLLQWNEQKRFHPRGQLVGRLF